MAFVGHAHCHDEFSPLDGTGTRNQLTRQAVLLGQSHIGVTNHGRLGSVLDHIDCCRHPEKYDDPDEPGKKRSKDERLIPWVGLEAFWRPDRFMDLSDREKYGKSGHTWANHLCLHAGSLDGWRTLMRLSSKSWVRREKGGGFYGKPVVDWDMIENDNEGIIVSTACLASPVSQLLLQGYYEEAKQWCLDMIDIVGEHNFFFEVMPHDLDMQREVNIGKINLANELGRPYMVTGDVHIPYREWADTHSIVRMAAYRTTVSSEAKKTEIGEEIYTEKIDTVFLSSEKQLKKMFADYHPEMPEHMVSEALNNTEVFARQFRFFNIGKAVKMPKVTKNVKEAERIIEGWCDEGLRRIGKHNDKEYLERYDYEYEVLKEKGVLDYFVMVGDLVRWAKSTDPLPASKDDPNPPSKRIIRVGLGRGSAAGCLISYLIGITAIDPISWRLLFERFLNPDRVGLPDIDIDFETELFDFPLLDAMVDGREYCKEYLKRQYGHDHVADIIAYQTFAPRAVIKAVLGTQDWYDAQIEKITSTIGDTERGLELIAKDNKKVYELKEQFPDLWEHMLNLEDQVLRDSRHAAGVVITEKPTNFYMPTQLGSDDVSTVTAWADRADFPVISDYGFVKLDVLGVKSLSKQELACHFIKKYYEEDFEPNDLGVLRDPYDADQAVIDLFVKGLTLGIFQFSGRGITQLLRHIKPDNAIDISVANALFRPGPIDIAFEYGDRKNGKTPISYWHESLEPILGETLGLMCFQEQAMEVVKQLAGFSGGDADNFRKIMSKLYRLPGDQAQQVMAKDRDRFIEGCMVVSGLKEETGAMIFDDRMLPLGNYLFNKSHSSSYGLQAYQDGHIKQFYPLAFYASMMTIVKKTKKAEQIEHLRAVMREAKVFDIDVVPPDINKSIGGWSIVRPIRKKNLQFGLVSIGGVGDAAVPHILEHRPFKSFKDYINKMPSNFGTNTTEALAKAGAFDFIAKREELLAQTRAWPESVIKLAIKMECGCKKSKTVKPGKKSLEDIGREESDLKKLPLYKIMDELLQAALVSMHCKKHDCSVIDEWEEVDPFYSIASFYKDNPKGEPEDIKRIPTPEELAAMETEALNIPLSTINDANRYAPFVEERIYTEEEFDELPAKPKKKGKEHTSFCACNDCAAAHCVIGGEIVSSKVITTKSDAKMAFIDVAFGANQWSITMFPEFFKRYSNLIIKPTLFLFAGHKDDRNQFIMYDMQDVKKVADAEGWTPKTIEATPRRCVRTKRKIKMKKKAKQ